MRMQKRYEVIDREREAKVRRFVLFLIRWGLTTAGLWVCVGWLGYRGEAGFLAYVIAALVFSMVNAVIKPILTLFALPMILLTMGLFVLIVNGLMVWFTILLIPGISMGFWAAVVAGIVMVIVNYLVNSAQQSYNRRYGNK